MVGQLHLSQELGRRFQRAYSKQDIRHNVNTSGLVQLPWGFSFSTILIGRSGVPLMRVIGVDQQGDGNDDKTAQSSTAVWCHAMTPAAPIVTAGQPLFAPSSAR